MTSFIQSYKILQDLTRSYTSIPPNCRSLWMLGGPLKWKWVLHELNSHALRANGDADRRIFCVSQFGISDLTIRSAAQSHWDLLHNHVDSWCMLHAILVPLAQGQSASSLADQSPKATQRDEKSLVQQNAIAEETLSKRPHTHIHTAVSTFQYIYIYLFLAVAHRDLFVAA